MVLNVNPSTGEAEPEESVVRLRPAWSIYQAPEESRLHRNLDSQNQKEASLQILSYPNQNGHNQ